MRIRTFMLTACVAALTTGGAIAQETTSGTDATNMGNEGAAAPAFEYTTLDQMTVGDVIGMNVIDPQGETIGEIDYVVPRGETADAVIGIGGFLGLGEYTVALPLGDFGLDAEQRVLTLDTTKEALEAQPEFDESGAESLPDETPVSQLIMADAAATDNGAADTGSGDTMTDDGAATEGSDAATDDGAATEGSDAATDDGAATEGGDTMTEEGTAEEGAATEGGDTMTEGSGGAAAEEGAEAEGAETEGADDAATEEETEATQ